MPTVYDYRQYYPYVADGGSLPRPLPARFTDVINKKDHAKSDDTPDTPGVIKFIDALLSTYTHGHSPNIVSTSRAGYVPGGVYEVDAVTAGSFVIGQAYMIATLGNTNFRLIGALGNLVGEVFTALGPGTGTGTARLAIRSSKLVYTDTILAPGDVQLEDEEGEPLLYAFVSGMIYQIVTVGTTNFTLIGSPNNTVGTVFRATGPGTGTGTARLVDHLGQFGFTIGGNGVVSQLRDINIELNANRNNVSNLRLVAEGDPIGTGLALRSSVNYVHNVDIQGKAIGIGNQSGFFPGSFGANNLVLGGWIRACDTGVAAAQNDLRLAFVRISDSLVAGIDYYDGGGLHFIGNHVSSKLGPAIRMRGKQFIFHGNTHANSTVITEVDNFSGISVNDTLSGGGPHLVTFQYNTRVTGINQGAGTITIAPPAIKDSDVEGVPGPIAISITNAVSESFHVNNTYNCDPDSHALSWNIASIVSANGGDSILITLTESHFGPNKLGIIVEDVRVLLAGTDIDFYDDNTDKAGHWVEALPNTTQVQCNIPFAGNVTGKGTFTISTFDVEVKSEGDNYRVIDQFHVGGNYNRNIYQGSTDCSFFGTRMNGKIFFDGCRPFRATRTLGSPVLTPVVPAVDFEIDTDEIRLGLPLIGTGIVDGSIVIAKTATTITLDQPCTATSSASKVQSPYQPNYWFHVAPITSGIAEKAADVRHPQGPGSLVGWGQMGMFTIAGGGFMADEGTYYVGGRAPWTQSGMAQFSVRDLNYYGIMNTGFRVRTCDTQYDIQGNNWRVNTGAMVLEEGVFGPESTGVVYVPSGKPMSLTTRAYRSGTAAIPGAVWGNAVHKWEAPVLATDGGATDDGGAFAILPGNNLDNSIHFMLGASANPLASVEGSYVDIRNNNPNIFDIRGIPQVSGWQPIVPSGGGAAVGTEYFRLAGVNTPIADSFIRADQDGPTRWVVVNDNTGINAQAILSVRNAATIEAGIRIIATGTGFTNGGAPLAFAPADTGVLLSGSLLSGGMSVVSLAGDMKFWTGASPTLPILAFGATGTMTFRFPQTFTPLNNGDTTISSSTNTSMTIRHRGGDGVVRSVVLTLA